MEKVLPILSGPSIVRSKGVSSNVHAFMTPVKFRSKAEIFPGIEQDSTAFRELKIFLFDEFKKTFGEQIDDFISGYAQVLCDWTVSAFPLSAPVEINTLFREELKLDEPTEDHYNIAKYLIEFSISNGDFTGIHIKKESQSGYPFFTRDLAYSNNALNKVLSNIDEFLDDFINERWSDTLQKFDAIPIASVGYRKQAEKIWIEDGKPKCKVRKYPTIKYTGVRHVPDEFTSVSNLVVDREGKKWNELIAVRQRDIFGYNRVANLAISGVLNNFLYSGYKKLPIAHWHGPDEASQRIKTFLRDRTGYPVSLDKSNFDKTMHHYYFDLFDEIISLRISPEISRAHALMRNAPTIFKDPTGLAKTWISFSFDDKDFVKKSWNRKQLKSGLGTVSIDGKILGAVDALVYLKRVFGSSFVLEKAIANSDPRFLTFSFGDDTMFYFINKKDAEKMISEIEKFGVHKDEVTNHAEFLGYKFKENGDYFRDISRFIESMTGRERSITTKRYPAIGLLSRINEYRSNPHYFKVMSILTKGYAKLNFDLEDLAKKGYSELAQSNMSYADLLFLNDPSIIMWKYEIGDIRKDLIAEQYAQIPKEVVEKAFTKYYRGL